MKEAMEMEDIYRRHAQTVYKFLLAQCRDADLAEELTAETFYQAVRSIGRYDGSCRLSGFARSPSICGTSICAKPSGRAKR